MKDIKIGKYRHFKGDIIEVLMLGKHSETLEDFVVYRHNNQIWLRPLEMFVSEVDHDKYPEITQKYRFERIMEEENEE